MRQGYGDSAVSVFERTGIAGAMLFLLLLLAALVVAGIVLAVTVIKWLFILAIVAALAWVLLFFVRRAA
jgi:hypothetical protein